MGEKCGKVNFCANQDCRSRVHTRQVAENVRQPGLLGHFLKDTRKGVLTSDLVLN